MKEQEKDQQFRRLCDDYRNLPPMEVLHPVLIDKVHRRKFIVVGQIYHPVKKRTCLCVFREDTLYFEHMDGFFDYEEQKVYIGNKFMQRHPIPARMNFLQRETFNTHWLYRFIEEGIYLRDNDGNPLYDLKDNEDGQTKIEF
jgi:hypothetical protein